MQIAIIAVVIKIAGFMASPLSIPVDRFAVPGVAGRFTLIDLIRSRPTRSHLNEQERA